jgi:transposase
MLATGAGIENVSFVVGCTVETIKNWVRIYETKGTESLNTYNYKPKKPYLTFSQISQVVIFVISDSPRSAEEIREYIKDRFNVCYCEESVRQLLKKRGLRFIRPRTVPGSPPSPEEQRQFIQQYDELRGNPEIKVLFGDAMHLIHQNLPSLCRGDPSLPPLPETNSARKRLNILGAYDIETHSLIHLTGEENCNADRVTEFLEKIRHSYRKFSESYLIADNARYFHAGKVGDWREDHPEIKLMFLPAYAPNLNLIERFRRLAKKNLVRNNYFREYKKFRAKVFQFLNNTKKSHISRFSH